jgi:hypothetical protein
VLPKFNTGKHMGSSARQKVLHIAYPGGGLVFGAPSNTFSSGGISAGGPLSRMIPPVGCACVVVAISERGGFECGLGNINVMNDRQFLQ